MKLRKEPGLESAIRPQGKPRKRAGKNSLSPFFIPGFLRNRRIVNGGFFSLAIKHALRYTYWEDGRYKDAPGACRGAGGGGNQGSRALVSFIVLGRDR
jgi:hypothetical protein